MSENNIVHIALNRIWDLVLANLLFIVCSIPLVTIGPSFTALHHCTLRIVKGNNTGTLKTFFRAFKENFRQSILVWLSSVLVTLLLNSNIQFLVKINSLFSQILLYLSAAIFIFIILLNIYIYPVIATFSGSLKTLIKNSFLFAFMHLISTLIMAILWFLPIVMTLIDVQLQTLYVFCWFFFGFSTIAYINSFMLYRAFKPYIAKDE